jgi:hypothetical protein
MQIFTSDVIEQKFINSDNSEFSAKTTILTSNEIEKLENPDFYSQASQNSCAVFILPIKVTDVLTDEDEVYNEEYLSQLRKVFKLAQDFEIKFFFLPQIDQAILANPDLTIKSMKHTARRLKKFENISGFVLPQVESFKDEKVRQEFISELSEKHEHYKFVDLA